MGSYRGAGAMRHCSSLLVIVAVALLWVGFSRPAQAADRKTEVAHRAVGVFEYIGADYPAAIRDGEVIDEFEYEEMKTLVDDVRVLVGEKADEALQTNLDKLEDAIDERAPRNRVATLARSAEQRVVRSWEIALHPESAPDFEQGRRLYAQHCTSCHGEAGRADVPQAEAMKPSPTDFRDLSRRKNLSPYRVFNTTRFGIEGTPMSAFDTLDAAERWDLAFYVTALAHGPSGRSETAPSRPSFLPDDFRPSLKKLAKWKNETLRPHLVDAGVPEQKIESALAYFRRVAPFRGEEAGSENISETESSPKLALIHQRLDEAKEAWSAGDASEARRKVLAAYLDGFEGMESRIAAVDGELLETTEHKFTTLREAIRRGDSERVATMFASLDTSLEEVDSALASGGGDWWTTAVASAVILLREGIEIVLLIALLLGMLERLGRGEAKRFVHGGWIAALGAGGATWVVARWLIAISGAGRELLEGIIGLIAAAILFSVSYWFLSQIHGQKWLDYLKSKLEDQAAAGRFLTIGGLSFLAVYREAFETVLFYQALIVQSEGAFEPIVAGVASAGLALAVIAYLILAGSKRLPMKQFFTTSGILLLALSVILTGEGLHALVEAGAIPSISVAFLSVPWLGVYPNLIPLVGQGLLVVAIVIWALWQWRERHSG